MGGREGREGRGRLIGSYLYGSDPYSLSLEYPEIGERKERSSDFICDI